MAGFGVNLRRLRLERGWTQQQLGDRIGKTKNNISQYELGKREPDFEQLGHFAQLFDVPIGELLDAPKDAFREIAEAFYESEGVLVPIFALLPPICPTGYRYATLAPEENPAFYCYAPEDALFQRIKKGDLLLVLEDSSPVQDALLLLIVNGIPALRTLIFQDGEAYLMPASPEQIPMRCAARQFQVLGRVLRAELWIGNQCPA